MKLIFTLACMFIATQAHASTECSLAAGEPVIESTILKLGLSANGRELVQKIALGDPGTKLLVKSNSTDQAGKTTISGDVEPVQKLVCAGSCGRTTFELFIDPASNGITPNAKLTKTTTRFNETSGKNDAWVSTYNLVCQ